MARDVHHYDPYHYESEEEKAAARRTNATRGGRRRRRANTCSTRLRVLLLFDRRFRVASLAAFAALLVVAFYKLHQIVTGTQTASAVDGVVAAGRRRIAAMRGAGKTTSETDAPGCPPYGCPIYPPELLDDHVRREIDLLRNRTTALSNSNGGRITGPVAAGEEGYSYSLPYGNHRMCALSQKGASHVVNQDRGFIISPFDTGGGSPSNGGGSGGPDDFLVCIFDGHADEGHFISEYLSRTMPGILHEKLTRNLGDDANGDEEEEEGLIKQMLFDAFVQADRDAPSKYALNGGSTASCVLRRGRNLFIANVGDSTSFVSTYRQSNGGGDADNVDVVYRNRFDKPHLPEERARIEGLGGNVHIPQPPKPPSMARVIAYSSVKKEMVGLAMSRSIGDWDHGSVGVIAEPIVDVVDIDEVIDNNNGQAGNVKMFVVSGSDGLFDKRRPEFVARRLARSLYRQDDDGGGGAVNWNHHPTIVECEEIIRLVTPANPNWYRDDVTVLALRVDV